MATNYMTVAEAEIGDLEARLWRIKQAIEIKDPKFITNRIDDELMKMRFENNEDRRLMATHPAKYTDSFIPIFAKLLMDCGNGFETRNDDERKRNKRTFTF